MKKSRVVSNALNNPKAGYSQPARLEPTVVWRRSRRLQLTALEQLSKVLEAKQESDPHTEKRTLPNRNFSRPSTVVPNPLTMANETGRVAFLRRPRQFLPGYYRGPLRMNASQSRACRLLVTAYRLLLTTYYLLLTACCLLLTAYRLKLLIHTNIHLDFRWLFADAQA